MTTPADRLNQVAAEQVAARAELERAEKSLDKFRKLRENERAAFDAAFAKREEAIEASVTDPEVTIPRLDPAGLELAERREAVAARQAESARQAVAKAEEALPAAEKALEIAKGLELMAEVYEEFGKSKALAALISLQRKQHVNEALFAEGMRISRNPQDRKLTLVFDGPAKTPSVVDVCVSALSAKAHPAAMEHYRRIRERDAAQAEGERALRVAEIDQAEGRELARLEENLASEIAGKHPNVASALAAKAMHLAKVAALKAGFAAERAQV